MSQRSLKAAAGATVLVAGLTGAGSALAAKAAKPHALACSQGAVQAAMYQGGSYAFTRSCTITLTKSLAKQYGSVTLSGGRHNVVFTAAKSLQGSAFQVNGGSLTLEHVSVTGITVTGAAGKAGGAGTSYSNTATGNNGGIGGNGGTGQNALGAGVDAAAGSTVTLLDDTFLKDTTAGGNGGSGGAGGNGDSGTDTTTAGTGPGGIGGAGGAGGAGGSALGGAVYSAGVLRVVGGSFREDVARGGTGAAGGAAGSGGVGGADPSGMLGGAGGQGGEGGEGGFGGSGGTAGGGAIYSTGVVSTSGVSYVGDQVYGGTPGNGNTGGNGAVTNTSEQAGGGSGGDGGNGGNGGNATGGAVDATGRGVVSGGRNQGNLILGGTVGPNCPASGVGCGGAAGTGAPNSAETTGTEPAGVPGAQGTAGIAASPNSAIGAPLKARK